MSFKVDNYKDIAIANFADSLKYHNNFEWLEDVDIFFRKVGISELINEYKCYLSKTVSNGKYINPNENFVYGLMKLMEKLSSKEEVFYRFILELTKNLEVRFWIDDYIIKEGCIEILESMKRNLAILGYEFSYLSILLRHPLATLLSHSTRGWEFNCIYILYILGFFIKR